MYFTKCKIKHAIIPTYIHLYVYIIALILYNSYIQLSLNSIGKFLSIIIHKI